MVVTESARSLSSAFLHQALLHDLFIQTYQMLRNVAFMMNQSGYLKSLPVVVRTRLPCFATRLLAHVSAQSALHNRDVFS